MKTAITQMVEEIRVLFRPLKPQVAWELHERIEEIISRYEAEEQSAKAAKVWLPAMDNETGSPCYKLSTPEAQKPTAPADLYHAVLELAICRGRRVSTNELKDTLERFRPQEQKPLCKVDPSFLCDELTAKPTAPVNLLELKKWAIQEHKDHALNDLDAYPDGFIVALCNKIDELTVKPRPSVAREDKKEGT